MLKPLQKGRGFDSVTFLALSNLLLYFCLSFEC